jgi:hypothetical protein
MAGRAACAIARLTPLSRALAIVLGLVGCAPPPPAPLAGRDPANPNSGAPRTEYRSGVGPYTSLRPTAPAAAAEPSSEPPLPSKSRP